MNLTISPVLTAIILGFVVLVFLAGLARKREQQKQKAASDPATWWLNSDAGRRDQTSGESATTRDDPAQGKAASDGQGQGQDDGGGGGDGD
jgi:hypothetical protein